MKAVFVLWLALQIAAPEVTEHVHAGMAASRLGHLPEAIAEFKKATELDPNLAVAFVGLGSAYMDSHDYGRAIPPLKRALELDRTLVGADQMLGYALLAEGNAAEAVPHLERSQAFDALGIAQLETGKLPEAVASLEAALANRPNDPDILYYLQRATALLSKQVFDTLISTQPGSARAHEALGESDALLRRLPEAEREYREALRLRPDMPGLQLALGELYASASQWVKAEQAFRAEARLRPNDAQTAYGLGSALLEQGKVQEARVELEHADALAPDMPETLYSLGKASLLEGKEALAEKSWTRLLRIESQTELAAQAHFGLANLYRRQGKVAESEREMELFKKLKSAAPAATQPE